MPDDSDSLEPVMKSLAKSTAADKARAGAVALLNVIPFAGGAIASIIGEVATHKRTAKICNALADLNERLEEHGQDPTKHLSQDQIIELVHDTLQTVATTSDTEKLAMLSRGLSYSFVSEDSFARKQVYLQILRGCSSIELGLLSTLYRGRDPFVIQQGGPSEQLRYAGSTWVVPAGHVTDLVNPGYFEVTHNEECRSSRSLLAFLAEHSGLDEDTVAGAARLLDGKGLAAAAGHLGDTGPCKVAEWRATTSGALYVATGTGALLTPLRPTPFEASKTGFGEQFMRFCGA